LGYYVINLIQHLNQLTALQIIWKTNFCDLRLHYIVIMCHPLNRSLILKCPVAH